MGGFMGKKLKPGQPVNKKDTSSPSQFTWWLWFIPGLILSAGVLYLLREQRLTTVQSGPISQVGYENFLRTCNPQPWAIENTGHSSNNWDPNIVLELQSFEQNDIALASRLKKASAKLRRILDEMKSHPLCGEDQCAYIHRVLASNDFKIVIHSLDMGTLGAYRRQEHSIRIPLTEIETGNKENIIRTFLHEFWHAQKTLDHTDNYNAVGIPLDQITRIGAAYNINAQDEKTRKPALEYALEQGDKRVLIELASLNQKSKTGALSSSEAIIWTQYSTLIQSSYQRKKHEGAINAQNFNRISKDLNKALAQKKTYLYEFSRGGENLVLHVHSYKKTSDGGAIFVAYGSVDENDKVTAFIYDTRISKYNSAHTHKMQGYNTMGGSMEISALSERDAEIAENGPAINALFYPERDAFHQQCEHVPLRKLQK